MDLLPPYNLVQDGCDEKYFPDQSAITVSS